MDRQETGNHVDDRTRHEERRNAPRALLMQSPAGFFDIGQATDTRAHGHANALAVGIGHFQAGVTHCLKTGCQAVLNEQIELAGFLDRQVLLNLEALYRAAKTGGVGRQVRMFNQTYATAASQNALPTARHIRTQWRQHTHTGDHDASTRHSTLLIQLTTSLVKKKPHAGEGSAVFP
ncbi:hypothetical protein D3C78_1235260 [compost metagenome]